MRDVKLWLAHEDYGGALRGVLAKSGEPTRPRQRCAVGALGDCSYRAEDDGEVRTFDTVGRIAVIPIMGPMLKDSWVEMFGGASTEMARSRVLAAAADDGVDGIFLLVDSGGGEVAGTDELAEAVARAAALKPVHAHADDGIMASAAYWVGSQASVVTASRNSQVGSIGVVAQVLDISAALEERGLVLHTVSTGDRKGLLSRADVSDETIAYVEEMLAPMFEEFKQAVKRGRGLGIAKVRESADGSVWSAKDAQARGLIDAVMGRDDAFAGLMDAAAQHREASRPTVTQGQRRRGEAALEMDAMRQRIAAAKEAAGHARTDAD